MREFLSVHQVPFTERNIRRDPEARHYIVNRFGAEVVPLTVIDDEMVIGFDQARLELLLGVES